MVFFTQRKIPGLHKGSTKLRASCKQREYMGFQVTVVLGASGRIGRLLRHCWSGEESRTRIRWQSRRPLPALKTPREALQEACLADPSQHTVLDILAEPQRLAELCRGADVVLCLAGSLPGRGGDLSDNSRLAIAAVQAAARAAQAPGLQGSDAQAPDAQAADRTENRVGKTALPNPIAAGDQEKPVPDAGHTTAPQNLGPLRLRPHRLFSSIRGPAERVSLQRGILRLAVLEEEKLLRTLTFALVAGSALAVTPLSLGAQEAGEGVTEYAPGSTGRITAPLATIVDSAKQQGEALRQTLRPLDEVDLEDHPIEARTGPDHG